MPDQQPFTLAIPAEALRPLITEIVRQVLAELEQQRAELPDEVMTEREAARVLKLSERQLADERRRGRITASGIVGRRIRYTRADVLAYLAERQGK
ncbi:MAG: helix-turn-helix domain-containing protein [Gemmataceae bacterium]